ncbi:DUF3616 domain-containing protein [Hydrogenovibrio marinus]|uniref:DUF3616 domain-containing protein n=1 Tax=Hydrogenovibrio marinus TaxID=28885 RepID=A0A066ZQT5_HYDMR|nr:DUF3616 domain-containing protein [Hydrogenovibrio marinus]KDN95872.1 hypothetical protein EI16_06155 [Hydrogenovibrio marinus]
MFSPLRFAFHTILLLVVLLPLAVQAQTSSQNPALSIIGKLGINAVNISGMVKTDQFLALATDEGTQIQILPQSSQGYVATNSGVIDLNQTQRAIKEFDLEAMAWQKPYLYVIGSHSKKRKKLKLDWSVKKNMERITPVIDEPDRRVLFRVELSETLKPLHIDKISLLNEIKNDPILSPFLAIPSKENGIDIEGLAVREHNGKTQLFVGFRGPVLRGNLTPILKLTLRAKRFEVKKSKLLLVNLGGFGIRDMQAMEDGFLLLSGPVNAVPNRFSLYAWDGKTQLSPTHEKLALPTQQNEGNPEAIATQNLPGWGQGIWMAKDGAENGDIRFYPFTPK